MFAREARPMVKLTFASRFKDIHFIGFRGLEWLIADVFHITTIDYALTRRLGVYIDRKLQSSTEIRHYCIISENVNRENFSPIERLSRFLISFIFPSLPRIRRGFQFDYFGFSFDNL